LENEVEIKASSLREEFPPAAPQLIRSQLQGHRRWVKTGEEGRQEYGRHAAKKRASG